MEKALKWTLPVLILVEIGLVRGGWLSLGQAALIAIGVEALLLIVGVRQVFVAWRRYRAGRAAGMDGWAALEDGLAVLLPRRVARVVALEPKVWACLVQWLRRRPLAGDEFSYAGRSSLGLLLLAALFVTPAEIAIAELLIPWAGLRWLLLILAVYTLIWLLGLYASLQVLPHRVDADGVRVRYGFLAEGYIPYQHIAHIEVARRTVQQGSEGLYIRDADALFAVQNRTDVTLRLSEPVILQRLLGETPPIMTVHLAVDRPTDFAQAVAAQAGKEVVELSQAMAASLAPPSSRTSPTARRAARWTARGFVRKAHEES